jgi:uracil-DNA glycosylase family 4
MDARAQLRRYLEQRREMGESELVLDGMTIEEAMRILGGGARSDAASRASRARPAATTDAAVSAERADARVDEPRVSTRAVDDSQLGTDWRAALRANGAAPESMARKPVDPKTAGVEAQIVPASYAVPVFESLDEIAKHVATCTKCPLYSTALNPVPGEGNPNADFMCVGEAPGATEDETGRPFVGAAGQLLTKILEAIGLKREDVFIVNVLKHRPPGNRNPAPDEVTACSPYLIRQIELVKPKVILALGTFAAQTLLDTKTSIGKLRGQVHAYHGVPLVVTYHPAALLRNPAWKRPTWEDVQLAHRIHNSAPVPPSGP